MRGGNSEIYREWELRWRDRERGSREEEWEVEKREAGERKNEKEGERDLE